MDQTLQGYTSLMISDHDTVFIEDQRAGGISFDGLFLHIALLDS